MVSVKDAVLVECHPSSEMSWEEFRSDCETALNTPELHSDEYSSNDEVLAQEERSCGKRPENILNTDSVIKIYNKTWRSSRVSISFRIIFLSL
jgi:hypothetical protein